MASAEARRADCEPEWRLAGRPGPARIRPARDRPVLRGRRRSGQAVAVHGHSAPVAVVGMSSRRHVAGQVLFLAALILGASSQGQAQRPPNVVLVMMDDLGYGDLGSYGASDVRTPNIDRLAREGVRLTDAYANGAVCTPTRAALMTGGYQQRVGLEWLLTTSPADLELGLAARGTSLPALLKANRYATALIGKWHLGWKP